MAIISWLLADVMSVLTLNGCIILYCRYIGARSHLKNNIACIALDDECHFYVSFTRNAFDSSFLDADSLEIISFIWQASYPLRFDASIILLEIPFAKHLYLAASKCC